MTKRNFKNCFIDLERFSLESALSYYKKEGYKINSEPNPTRHRYLYGVNSGNITSHPEAVREAYEEIVLGKFKLLRKTKNG